MARSRVKGAAQMKRTLRRLPEEAREELADTMTVIGNRLLGRARAEVPVRTGRLRSLLAARVLPRSLQLKLGLVTRGTQRKGFYGYILDAGRRARTVKAKRRTGTVYTLRVRGISSSRYDFVFGRRRDFLRNELDTLRQALNRVLGRVARGGGADD
jgi:hypothetical protein